MKQFELQKIDSNVMLQSRDAVESSDFPDDVKSTLKNALTTLEFLQTQLDEKKISQDRLRKIAFGSASEKMDTLFPDVIAVDGSEITENEPAGPIDRPKGHGRRNLKLHVNAETEVVKCNHEAGSSCPTCKDGKLKNAEPLQRTCIQTLNLVSVQVFEIEALRCGTCSHREVAPLPPVLADCFGKYHISTVTHLAFSRYAMGLPSNRIKSFTEYTGLKISDTTQFRLFDWAASQIFPVFKALCQLASDAKLTYRDDSPNKILQFQNQQRAAKKRGEIVRVGVTTTNVTAKTDQGSVSLFFTGTEHAGEVIKRLLSNRQTADPMIGMADAASSNRKHESADRVIEAACLAHARRKFHELQDVDKHATSMILGLLQTVYQNDATSIKRDLNPRKRLKFHQQNSQKFMNKIHSICLQESPKAKQPSLKAAYAYTLRHWERLTQFLKIEGAPLDNNVCEREIKASIRHRKNSLFFRSEDGALVGDVLMSVFRTAQLNKVNPIEYLEYALRNREAVRENPQMFLPTMNCTLSN